jgi:enoyl-CoA hydratase/carnithine racemase
MLRYRTEPPVAWATLDRPEKLNAMTRELWGEMRDAVARAEADPEVRVLIFNGNGRSFSVGGDIEGFGELGDAGDRRSYMREAIGAMRAVEDCPKPTIAAIHGHCAGGGCELTLVCDLVVADETVKIGTPEATVGLVPGPGLARGSSHCNLHWMKYMVMTGELLDAEQARLAGLVNLIVPAGEHEERARQLAEQIAKRAPLALEASKQALNRQYDRWWEQAMDTVSFLQGTADFGEGIAAFEERREPTFKGR